MKPTIQKAGALVQLELYEGTSIPCYINSHHCGYESSEVIYCETSNCSKHFYLIFPTNNTFERSISIQVMLYLVHFF